MKCVRTLMIFAVLRGLEAIFFLISIAVTDNLLRAKEGVGAQVFFGEYLSIARMYYVDMAYVLFSGTAFLALSAMRGGIGVRHRLEIANAGVLVVHWLAVVIFLYAGRIGFFLTIVWLPVVVFNLVIAGYARQLMNRSI